MIGIGIGIPFARASAVWQGILDLIPSQAAFAAELRLLTNKYTGPLAQLRRSLAEGGTVTSITRVGTTATVVFGSAHTFVTGEYAQISGAGQAGYNIVTPITVISPTSISYPVAATAATPATGTMVVNKVKDFFPTANAMKPKARYVIVRRTTGSATDAFEVHDLAVMSGGVNRASASLITTSHPAYPGYPASAAIDGNIGTAFVTNGSFADAWLQIDMGAEYEIDSVLIYSSGSNRMNGVNIYMSRLSMSSQFESTYASNPNIWKVTPSPLARVSGMFSYTQQAERWVDTAAALSFCTFTHDTPQDMRTWTAGNLTVTRSVIGGRNFDTLTGSSVGVAQYKLQTNFNAPQHGGGTYKFTFRARPAGGTTFYFQFQNQAASSSGGASFTLTGAGTATGTGTIAFDAATGDYICTGTSVIPASPTQLQLIVWLGGYGNATNPGAVALSTPVVEYLGSAFVVGAYDQSGNGRHEWQRNVANQPRLVNAGVLDTLNGRPTMQFISANGTFMTSAFALQAPMTISTVINVNGYDAAQAGTINNVFDGMGFDTIALRLRTVGSIFMQPLVGGSSVNTDAIQNTGLVYTIATGTAANSATAYRNGALIASNFGNAAVNAGGITLGAYAGGGARSYNGELSGLVAWPSNLSSAAARALYERNAGAAYGIPIA